MTAAAPAPVGHADWMDSVYERLAGDEDGRVCKAISEDACRQTPGNFFRMLVANALGTLADGVASAKTTLPWLLLQLGAPGWMGALLVPIRESGSMLPQLLIGAAVRRRPIRKGVWVAGAAVQGFSLLALGAVALWLGGAVAGVTVLVLVTLFSLARGACSVAYKDVQGKTIPKSRRGRLAGWIGAVAGVLAMAVGLGLGVVQGTASTLLFAGLLVGAGALWLLAGWAFGRIVEYPGATEGGVDGVAQALGRLSLLGSDADFRRFVVARALAMGSGLAAPFYVAQSRASLGEALGWLGAFIALEGLAGLASGPLWGRWADRSSRGVFAAASALAGALSVAMAALAWWPVGTALAVWLYPLAFLGLGVAHAGVRLGRKTYLVDMAEGDRRTDYVAVSNSVIGALLLAAGALSALAAAWSAPAVVLGLGLAGLAGAALSLRWRDVSG